MYHFTDNFSGETHEFIRLREAKVAAREYRFNNGGPVYIYKNDTIVCQVANNFLPLP